MSRVSAGRSIVWMAPSAKNFKTNVIAGTPHTFTFDDNVDVSFFDKTEVERPETIVVSAQQVSRQFMEAWRKKIPFTDESSVLTLVRRGTSLGSIDLEAAKEFNINVINTPGVNSPHVAKFVVENLELTSQQNAGDVKAVVVGAGSVGKFIIQQMNDVGVVPKIVDASAQKRGDISAKQGIFAESLDSALKGATHVAISASTSGKPIVEESHVDALLGTEAGEKDRAVRICCIARPEAFSLEGILKLPANVHCRFDYGDMILKPTRDKVNEAGGRTNISWSSAAMGSEACKEDLDAAVLEKLA